MVSHIFTLGVIQSARCVLGLGLAYFLIYRSWFIPLAWQSRLEPGDRAAFLYLGVALALLAFLRGMQGAFTLRAVRRWRRENRTPVARGRPLNRIFLTVWALLWVGAGGTALYGIVRLSWILNAPFRERLLLYEAMAAWGLLSLVLAAYLFVKFRGRTIRRFGLALAVVDLVNLAGFPINFPCGVYGLLVNRHPDTRDFFEMAFSGEGQEKGEGGKGGEPGGGRPHEPLPPIHPDDVASDQMGTSCF